MEPQVVAVQWDKHLTHPFWTADRLELLCSLEGGSGQGALSVWSRDSPDASFALCGRIAVPGHGPLFGRSPRYVEATRELFFSAPDSLKEQSAWESANWDIWVVKNFETP